MNGVIPRRIRIVGPALITLALLSGCASGAAPSDSPSPPSASGQRPTSTAMLSIVSPENGTIVHGSTIRVELSLDGARIVKQTSTDLAPDEGHVHVLLDGELISMTFGLEQRIADVEPGPHRVEVEFVAADHAPFDPRVTAVTSFQVQQP